MNDLGCILFFITITISNNKRTYSLGSSVSRIFYISVGRLDRSTIVSKCINILNLDIGIKFCSKINFYYFFYFVTICINKICIKLGFIV